MTKAEWHPRNLTDLVRRELRMAPDGTVRLRPGREQGASFAAFQVTAPTALAPLSLSLFASEETERDADRNPDAPSSGHFPRKIRPPSSTSRSPLRWI